MNQARRLYAATLLPSGRVLVGGGYSGSLLRSVEIYDPSAPDGQKWTQAANMPVGHRRHGILLTKPSQHTGKVLIVGENSPSKTAHLFDETTGPQGSWASTGNEPIVQRYSSTLVELPNGKILYAGGYCGAACATFNSA